MKETDLELSDGRRLHIYDTGADVADASLAIFWHHGTPNLGEPPAPLLPAAAERGIRWVSYDRPGYGGSTLHPGRTWHRRRPTFLPSPMPPSSHGKWLARRIRSAELWLRPDVGHISVLNTGAAAMDWLLERAN